MPDRPLRRRRSPPLSRWRSPAVPSRPARRENANTAPRRSVRSPRRGGTTAALQPRAGPRDRRLASAAASDEPRDRRARSSGSWRRIRSCSSRSSALGSTPMSSTSRRRAATKASSASAWRPDRYSASIRWACRRSRSGCSVDQPLELGSAPPARAPRPGRRRRPARPRAAAARRAGGSRRPRTARPRRRPTPRRATARAPPARGRSGRRRRARPRSTRRSKRAGVDGVRGTPAARSHARAVTISASSPASSRRSCDTYSCTIFGAVAGGASPHSPSTRRIDAHGRVRVEREHRRGRPAAWSRRADRPVVDRGLDRPEQLHVHRRSGPLGRVTPPYFAAV